MGLDERLLRCIETSCYRRSAHRLCHPDL